MNGVKQITLRLPDGLYKKVKLESERKGQSIKDLMIIYLWDYCETHNRLDIR